MNSNQPINPLQTYLLARGITVCQMARDLGMNMHRVQKTVKLQRFGAETRAAIARHLGLDPQRTWRGRGLDAAYLHRMTEKAIMDAATAAARAKIEALREGRKAA